MSAEMAPRHRRRARLTLARVAIVAVAGWVIAIRFMSTSTVVVNLCVGHFSINGQDQWSVHDGQVTRDHSASDLPPFFDAAGFELEAPRKSVEGCPVAAPSVRAFVSPFGFECLRYALPVETLEPGEYLQRNSLVRGRVSVVALKDGFHVVGISKGGVQIGYRIAEGTRRYPRWADRVLADPVLQMLVLFAALTVFFDIGSKKEEDSKGKGVEEDK